MRIERNNTARIHQTPNDRYLVVDSVSDEPVFLLIEIFVEGENGWNPLACAPFDDPRVTAVQMKFEGSLDSTFEVPLPSSLPEPLGMTPGESWVQFRSQSIASWGPGFSWWQRMKYRIFGRSGSADTLRNITQS